MQETNVNASGSSSNFNPNSELPQVGTTLLPDANTTTHSQHGPIVRSRSHVDNFNHTVLQTSTPLAEIRAIDTSSRGSIGNNSSRNSSKDTLWGRLWQILHPSLMQYLGSIMKWSLSCDGHFSSRRACSKGRR